MPLQDFPRPEPQQREKRKRRISEAPTTTEHWPVGPVPWKLCKDLDRGDLRSRKFSPGIIAQCYSTVCIKMACWISNNMTWPVMIQWSLISDQWLCAYSPIPRHDARRTQLPLIRFLNGTNQSRSFQRFWSKVWLGSVHNTPFTMDTRYQHMIITLRREYIQVW